MQLKRPKTGYTLRKTTVVLLILVIGPIVLLYQLFYGIFRTTTLTGNATKKHFLKYPELSRTYTQQIANRRLSSLENSDIIVYSALMTSFPNSGAYSDSEVVLTILGSMEEKDMKCCFVTFEHNIMSVPATVKFSYYSHTATHIGEYLTRGSYLAFQYKCLISSGNNLVMYVNIAPHRCPDHVEEGITVINNNQVKGIIAICSKLTGRYEPTKQEFINWIEFQIRLGIDKIYVYDLLGSKNLSRVFEYYEKYGILEVYRFPVPKHWSSEQGVYKALEDMQVETLPLLDCRHRAAGFMYVLCLDLDKLIAPTAPVTLSQLFNDVMEDNPRAAGFYIDVDWSLTNPIEGETSRARWINDKPAWEATMLMFLPQRVYTPNLSAMQPQPTFSTYKMSPDKAKLRHCPTADWNSCFPEPRIKNRFRTLNYRIRSVLTDLGIYK